MDQIFDYKEFKQEYENYSEELLSQFEKNINENMQELFQMIMQQNWEKTFSIIHCLKGLGSYSFSRQIVQVILPLEKFLFPYRKPYTLETVSLNESLDDEAKLKAMDLFLPIPEEVCLLILEMSKYTNSGVPQNIFLKEIEQIRELHENMKKQYQMNQAKSQTINSVITQLDKPENASCTEKCIIF